MEDLKWQEGPVLTFEPFKEEKTVSTDIQQQLKEQFEEDNILTSEEQAMVDAFAAQIDLHHSTQILQYGAGAQQKVADFSEKALENVKTKDLGDIGQLISHVVDELKQCQIDEEEKGFFGLFKRNINKIQSMKNKYQKAEISVKKIVETLEDHQVLLMKDVATLDQLYDMNKTYYKELTMYIFAGRKKLEEFKRTELNTLTKRAEKSGNPEDAQAVNDCVSMMNRFEKKLHDLELTRMIAIQMAPQIRLVQNNDTMMIEKIQSTIVNTIPLWKSQMVIALGLAHSEQAAKLQREVSDLTNDMLRKNADRLKSASVQIAQESERGIVDMETLQQTNKALIDTFDEVLKIQAEGRSKRQNAEEQLRVMENELKQKLLDIRNAL